jgi:phosphoribosylformylglycinamidine synthase
MKPRVLVLRAAGTNCDLETELAFQWCGAATARVHINALVRGTERLLDHDVLVLPGGFSYGDHIAAGRVLAAEVKMLAGLEKFISSGRPVLGICNGFQVLVKSGVLPGHGDGQTVSLTTNDSGRFECGWARLKVNPASFFLKGMPDVIELPVAHGEGKFVAPDSVLDDVEPRIALRYLDNPSGSMRDIAGLTNKRGNVFGLMPHPERYLTAMHHPAGKAAQARELGLQIIRNCTEHVRG